MTQYTPRHSGFLAIHVTETMRKPKRECNHLLQIVLQLQQRVVRFEIPEVISTRQTRMIHVGYLDRKAIKKCVYVGDKFVHVCARTENVSNGHIPDEDGTES